MTAIVVPIQHHEFEDRNNNSSSSNANIFRNDNDDDVPTNDSLDEISRPLVVNTEGQQNDNNNSTAIIEDEMTTVPSSTWPVQHFGGLNNMGNTCYLNSALQMLASLDDFGDQIQKTTIRYDSKLRQSLVDVLTRLNNGETVRPDDFKTVVDERTSLFIGYRQQDSHEFLTTLLDLLDEDFKKKDEDEKKDGDETNEASEEEASETPVVADDVEEKMESAADDDDSPELVTEDDETTSDSTEDGPDLMSDDQMENEELESEESMAETENVLCNVQSSDISLPTDDLENTELVPCDIEMDEEIVPAAPEHDMKDDSSYVVVEREEEGDDGRSSPTKKQKIDGSHSEDEEVEDDIFEDAQYIPTMSSFRNLQFSDIENLLHGDKAGSEAPTSPSKEETSPRCKLVGGRMSTVGVQLTPLENDEDYMQEETPIPSKPDQSEPGSDDAPIKSPIDYTFATEVRVCLTCDSCKYRRSHTEKYLHLSLEIGDDCCSIEDGLRKFFAPEKREIKCEKCFCETAMQATEITRLPRAMLFHLKRFIVSVSPDYTSISYSKDQSAVSFEETLPFGEDSILSEFLADDVSLPEGSARYGIRSVVNHIGSSASCGHYTADGHRRYENGRSWTRFNDSMVSKISDQEAIQESERTAYMVMYEVGA